MMIFVDSCRIYGNLLSTHTKMIPFFINLSNLSIMIMIFVLIGWAKRNTGIFELYQSKAWKIKNGSTKNSTTWLSFRRMTKMNLTSFSRIYLCIHRLAWWLALYLDLPPSDYFFLSTSIVMNSICKNSVEYKRVGWIRFD